MNHGSPIPAAFFCVYRKLIKMHIKEISLIWLEWKIYLIECPFRYVWCKKLRVSVALLKDAELLLFKVFRLQEQSELRHKTTYRKHLEQTSYRYQLQQYNKSNYRNCQNRQHHLLCHNLLFHRFYMLRIFEYRNYTIPSIL